ncbi:metabotropic glutamate receptor 2-like isoform X2 [Daphnia pulicaria]|uniref:metabotropic glutamate receptor 2-like isoform X2 n=1 Tax=Daphnia pulicaria TaxID=35523 RepID=UPI001EEA0D39|nr:metabotropic glutamate receptor 2-like isoform X2 [Daphnia pulicaria]
MKMFKVLRKTTHVFRVVLLLWLSMTAGSVQVVSRQDGDIMLGALFPIHAKGSSPEGCGSLQGDDGIQPLEALHYTLDQINRDPNLLPNITLGVLAFDSCDNIVNALDQCLDFIKGTVEKSFVTRIQEEKRIQLEACSAGSSDDLLAKLTSPQKPVVGVIGDQSSDITIQVTSLLRIFKIPLISYQSTSPTLSDRERFAYFFRTVPSDVTQAYAILEILRNFNWTFASLVYEDSEYGVKGYETLLRLASRYGVCFAAQIRVDVKHFKTTDYDQVLGKLQSQSQSRIVVLFSGKSCATQLMAATKRVATKHAKPLIWVGCDGWSSRDVVTAGYETIVEGAITVQPLVRHLDGFDTYFKSLRPDTNIRNPWFSEYWQDFFKCRLKLEQLPRGIMPSQYSDPCKPGLHITDKRLTSVKFLQFIRDAVYAYAHALHNQWQVECEGRPGVCEKMRNAEGSVLKYYLEGASFTDQNKRVFKFYHGGDGPPRYSVLNFQKHDDDSYIWKEIGIFYLGADDLPKLEIDRKVLQYRRYEKLYPNSTCKEHCDAKKGLVPYLQSNNSCCPDCKKCEPFEMIQGGHCQPCPNGFLPNENRSRCVSIDEQIIDYRNPWAAGSMAFALFGILLTLAVAFIFWRHRQTPVIKASGRELSAILLLATLCSFAMTFLIASRPTGFKCGVTRFSLGLTHTVAFAAIAVKTNRVARIFGTKKTGSTSLTCPRAKYISPRSQLAITGALTLIEVFVNASWLIYQSPRTTHIFPDRYKRVLICEGMDHYTYLVGLVYPLILIGCCTVYAFQTRKCPGGFNEARYIGFSTYTTCVLWMAFIPLFLTAPTTTLRIVTLAMSMSISGIVQLACLFAPKVYIVLCKPEKNTRTGVMAQHRSSSYALATPPSIALHPLHNNQGSQLTIANGTEVGELFADGHHQQQQRRKSIQAQHLLGASSDCEENTMRLTPHNSELHLPDDTVSESSVYTLKMKRPSKGTVHFDCEDIDVIDQQQQKQQQLKVDNECNNFDSKSID